MSEYINHLETVVNNVQETLEKTKHKLKDSNQAISRVKIENDALEKQHQYELKMHQKTKEELENCNKKLSNSIEVSKEIEKQKDMLKEKLSKHEDTEKQRGGALDEMSKECKKLENENREIKKRMQMYLKDRDESLKEQKDLINKYSILSKEVQKLQEKYRHVKTECNERAKVIKYLEMMLKESILEYNNKIVGMEKNITNILEKIVVCKSTIKDKNYGADPEIQELRHQLDTTYKERKHLENELQNYYSEVKHLENEIQEKEKKVDELHEQLSLEHQKASNEWQKKVNSLRELTDNNEIIKVKKLETDITVMENELQDYKKKLKQCEDDRENEKKLLEMVFI